MTKLIRIPPQLRRLDLERRLPRNANFRDRTGEKLNGSVVLGYAGILKHSFSAWLCRCDCGKKFITADDLKEQAADDRHATCRSAEQEREGGVSSQPSMRTYPCRYAE